MDRQKIALISAAVLVGAALYAAWLWQPARQVRRHTAHFLKAVEGRSWDTAGGFVAEDYSDRWGHDKENVLADARAVFAQFLFLTIQAEPEDATVTGGSAEIRSPVKLAGRGGPLAELVVGRVNGLRAPFVFTWQQRSWKPWDWQLVRLDHPELEIENGREF